MAHESWHGGGVWILWAWWAFLAALVLGVGRPGEMKAGQATAPAPAEGAAEKARKIQAALARLPKGTDALPADALWQMHLIAAPGQAEAATVEVAGQAFAKALRVTVKKPAAQRWDIQLVVPTAAPVRGGPGAPGLLALFWVRAVKGQPDSGEAFAEAVFESAGAPWDKSLEQAVTAARDWTLIAMPFRARQDYAAGKAQFNLRVGFGTQTIELADVRVVDFGRAVKSADLPSTSIGYEGAGPNAPWRKDALERIEKIRKAPLEVTVTDASGRPAAGATVKVEMTRHAFPFGSAVAARLIVHNDSPDAKKYRQMILDQFNHVTIENNLKWPGWDSARQRALDTVAWLNEHGVSVRGHCLVWPNWRYIPRSVYALRDDPPALRKCVVDHVTDEITALKGRLVECDVINEPFSNHVLMDILGDEAMVEWFQAAHKADPKLTLYINDYSIVSGGGVDLGHQQHYAKTIRYLLDKGAPLGGIGIQSHFGGTLTPPARVLKVLDRFAEFKLPMQITELDVDIADEQLQADYLRDFMIAAFSHPRIEGIIMWGFWEGSHWKPAAALFRRDWTVKPNGQAWIDLVHKQWKTSQTGKADARGRFALRGFLGDYRVTVSWNGATKTATASLGRDGRTLSVKL